MTSNSRVLFKGIPDDRQANIRTINEQRGNEYQELVIHGMMQYPVIEEACQGKVFSTWLNIPLPDIRLPAPPFLGINCIADPDRSDRALQSLEILRNDLNIRVLNKPDAVRRCDRVGVANALESIKGLIVPSVIKLVPISPEMVFQAAQSASIDFPFLARNAASHGGQLVRLDSQLDRERLFELNWGRQPFYITAFHNFQSQDGLFRKYRIMVIGKQRILRHVIIGEDYLLRMEKRLTNDKAKLEEKHAIESFERTFLPKMATRLDAIQDALDLDIFGIDFALSAEGDMIIFEANPAMNFFYNPKPNDIWDVPIENAKNALRELLAFPQYWRDVD